ncbi:MAG: hypothetical protein AAB449_02660 [Patescibacteria group bacterium]
MDTDIEDLKEMIKRVGALAEDTNNTVHKMHRAAMWSRILSWVWWGTIIILTGSVYYYFLTPYLGQLMELYGATQSGGSSIQDFINQYRF